MVIGVTGLMGSGKSTLCSELSVLTGIRHLDVDKFRRGLEAKDKKLACLKSTMYYDEASMCTYKQVLYSELEASLNKISDDILLDWALLIQDGKTYLCNKLILLQTPLDLIYKRNSFTGLTRDEVKLRLELQSANFLLKDIECDYITMPLPDIEYALHYIKRGVEKDDCM